MKSAKSVVRQTIDTAAQAAQDLLVHNYTAMGDVPRGEGCLLDLDGEKVAAFRDDDDRVVLLSSTCTHMGCTVHWNAGERTWDCPCHGSRFTIEGDVLEGPALAPLPRYGAPVAAASRIEPQ